MEITGKPSAARGWRLGAAGLTLLAACACSLLKPSAAPPPASYALEAAVGPAAPAPPDAAPTLIVDPPGAAAGFDSRRIIYVRETHRLDSFAKSEWVDPPARMLLPLLVAAVERTGAFRAVVPAPSAAAGDLRLDTEVIRLQHEFLVQPSRVRFTLRARLVDAATRRVLAGREFEAVVPAAAENPYGGVVAANRAVQAVLENLAAFCAGAVRGARAGD